MNLRLKLVSTLGTVLAAGAIAASPMVASAATGAAALVVGTTSLTPVQLVGGSGSYQFSSIACAGTDGVCTASSSGSYVNTVCGTGTADGTVTITAHANFLIHIQFVAGIGVITGPGPSVPPVGVAILVATGVGTPPNCVTSFDVAAAAVIP